MWERILKTEGENPIMGNLKPLSLNKGFSMLAHKSGTISSQCLLIKLFPWHMVGTLFVFSQLSLPAALLRFLFRDEDMDCSWLTNLPLRT